MFKHAVRAAARFIFAFAILSCAARAGLVFTEFNAPGSNLTQGQGLNNAGQIVGSSRLPGQFQTAFLKDGATFTSFVYPGASGDSYANGINSSGVIVGSAWAPVPVGYVKDGSTFTTLSFAPITYALGINDSGEVVGLTSNGLYGTPAEVGHGFSVNKNGTGFSSFDVPGSVDTQAEGINNLGMIVGVASSTDRATWQGFLKNGSTYTSINVPGAVSTWANGINDAGEIVGDYSDGTHSYGFLETGGTYTTFSVPGRRTLTSKGSTTPA